MFTICPECGNDKLKVKAMAKRMYDPASQRMTVDEETPMVEYHCSDCQWTILLEDPPFVPEELVREMHEERAGQLTGVRRGEGD